MATIAGDTIPRRAAPIEFVCSAHVGLRGSGSSGTLTTVDGRWAYCRASLLTGHRWIATPAVPIGSLLDEAKPA